MKPNRILIKYLDLGDGRYIENDKVKNKLVESDQNDYLTWDKLWSGVKSDMGKIQKYVQEQEARGLD